MAKLGRIFGEIKMNFQKTLVATLFLVLFVGFVGLTHVVNAAASVTLSSPAQTETTVTLSWTQSNDWLFSSYELYYSSTGVNGPYSSSWSTTNKGETITVMHGLSPNTDYWFYILDSGSFVGSTPSNTLQVKTKQVPSLRVNAKTTTTVSLLWDDYNTYSSLVPFDGYTVQMSTSGASGPWSTLTTIADRSQNTYTETGLSPGQTYYFRMYDSVGISGNIVSAFSNIVSVTVVSQLTATISTPTAATDVGLQTQFSASANGGTPPYSYQWYSNGNPVTDATSSSFTFSPTSPGTYNIYATVKDSSNTQANSNSIAVTVNPQVSASATVTPLSSSILYSNDKATLTVTATGGSGSYTFDWYLNGVQVDSTTSSSYTYVFKSMGQQSLQSKVTDSAGYTVESDTAIVTYSYNYLLFGLIAGLAVIVVVVIIVVLRRHSRKSTPRTSEPTVKAQP
jgi:hypothetical protein